MGLKLGLGKEKRVRTVATKRKARSHIKGSFAFQVPVAPCFIYVQEQYRRNLTYLILEMNMFLLILEEVMRRQAPIFLKHLTFVLTSLSEEHMN